ncbi:MAG: RNA polymerase sigma factor RpoD/SigA [Spirochaetes bacterium]|nr:RNA polymerase sigma factor RpoD/SigA [Spirochaetota bacterium]
MDIYIENTENKFDDKDYLLRTYLQDIQKYPLLTRNEELNLARRAKEGDELAKQKIINSNLRFVVSIAKQFQNQGLPLMDLIAEGNIGLLTAIERFDPDTGNHFISYAVWWIRQSIMKAISEKSRLIRLPLNRVGTLLQVEKLEEKMRNKGENLSIENIAKTLNVKDEDIQTVIQSSSEIQSLDSQVSSNTVIADLIADSSETPLESALKMDIQDIVNSLLSELTEKEQQIIKMRFGIDTFEEMSLLEIGKKFNLTKERIRQIEKRIMEKLMNSKKTEKIREEFVA